MSLTASQGTRCTYTPVARDATEAFEDVGHSDEARALLKDMLVGDFEKTDVRSILSVMRYPVFKFFPLPGAQDQGPFNVLLQQYRCQQRRATGLQVRPLCYGSCTLSHACPTAPCTLSPSPCSVPTSRGATTRAARYKLRVLVPPTYPLHHTSVVLCCCFTSIINVWI